MVFIHNVYKKKKVKHKISARGGGRPKQVKTQKMRQEKSDCAKWNGMMSRRRHYSFIVAPVQLQSGWGQKPQKIFKKQVFAMIDVSGCPRGQKYLSTKLLLETQSLVVTIPKPYSSFSSGMFPCLIEFCSVTTMINLKTSRHR